MAKVVKDGRAAAAESNMLLRYGMMRSRQHVREKKGDDSCVWAMQCVKGERSYCIDRFCPRRSRPPTMWEHSSALWWYGIVHETGETRWTFPRIFRLLLRLVGLR